MDRQPGVPSISEMAAMLSRVEHFRGLPVEEIASLVGGGIVQRHPKGTVIFTEGDPSAGLFVLLAGQVQICKLGRQGQLSIISVFDPIRMFNESAALDDGPNPVTVIASRDTVVWRLSGAGLQALILKHPRVGLGIMRVLAQRNRKLVAQFEDLSFRTVLSRSAKLLLELSDNGTLPIDRRFHPNHQLAARIATVPEAFSRSLQVFKKKGQITSTVRSITILLPEQLSCIAQLGGLLQD